MVAVAVAIGLRYIVYSVPGGFGDEMEEKTGCLLSFSSQWMLDTHVT